MTKIKSVEEKYKKLDHISHILLRPGRYIGSITPHTANVWSYNESDKSMYKEDITWIPGFIKIFDEIITNSVDFSKTEDGKHLKNIKVNIDKFSGEISVADDGGIVVEKHKQYDQWVPELIFELMAGSNFDDTDESELSGQNGEGAGLSLVFSKSFTVETCDGKNQFIQLHTDNSRSRYDPQIKPNTKKRTIITYTPDFEKLGMTHIDDGNYKKLVKRVVDVAGCNPHLNVFLNGQRIVIKSFEDYIKMYTDEYVFVQNEKWKVALAASEDGFQHVSFVNTTETMSGGNHIKYITDQITVKLREYINKKYKTDIKPTDITNHFMLFVDCNIVNPRYNSQTKELLMTEIKNFGTSIEITDKFIKQLLETSLVANIVDWLEAKRIMQEERDKEKDNKTAAKANPKHVEKFTDASYKNRDDCILFLVEGNSASQGIKNNRSDKMGVFPLRGKPLSCLESLLTKILNNKEFKNIRIITGLQIGVPLLEQNDGEWYSINNTLVNNNDFILINSMYKSVNAIEDKTRVLNVSDETKKIYEKNKTNRLIIRKLDGLRFGKICISTDQDLDGFHIRGLLIAFFYKFWPELFSHNVICILDTPLAKVTLKKKVLSFYSLEELDEWRTKNTNETYTTKYYKGLGTSSNSEWKENLSDSKIEENVLYVDEFTSDDISTIKLLFSKMKGMANARKLWLDIE